MPKYIVTADLHLKRAVPPGRPESPEEWETLQLDTLRSIKQYALENYATLLIVGDIFDTSAASSRMLNAFTDVFLPIADQTRVLAGNHDLPYHNFANVEDSSYGNIRKHFKEIPNLGEDSEIGGFHFNQEYDGKHQILCTHQLVFDSEKEVEICGSGKTARMLLDEFPHAKYIFTGDMHHKFIYEHKGRVVVNPGSVTRQSIKYVDYAPSCYLVDTDNGEIDELPLPDHVAVISTDHRDQANERDARIASFLEVVKNKGIVSLDFIGNLEALDTKKLSKILDAVYDSIDKVKVKDLLNEIINELKQDDENEC